jgi:hypothetical protein
MHSETIPEMKVQQKKKNLLNGKPPAMARGRSGVQCVLVLCDEGT